MSRTRYIDHQEALLQDLKNPEFRRAYLLLKPRYDLVRELVNLRVDLGVSQSELARRAGTHQSRISKIESAGQEVTLGTIIRLADSLNADVEIRLVRRQHAEFFAEIQHLCAETSKGVWKFEDAPFRVPLSQPEKVFA